MYGIEWEQISKNAILFVMISFLSTHVGLSLMAITAVRPVTGEYAS